MKDLIERLNYIKNWKCGGDSEMYKTLNDAISALENLIPSRPEQRWIPVSEGLPKEGMRIIIQYGDGSLGVIDRVSLKIWSLANSPYAKVVAWMPLPEPYKGEQDGHR